ncbi:MAG: HNH endonuclease signature motif containing protein [Candidatus Sumerlaeales bacterium]|nr:HNH endonuclease signature motif containing protein [Candidatus Sumerlaeales bacterium]
MKTIYYDGLRFTRDDATGYYRNTKTGERLHRYIYEQHYGELPSDMSVHHIDHNKDNNSPENLTALDRVEHMRHHGETMSEEQRQWCRDNINNNARPAACVWHGSDEGREWHKKHYEQMKDAFHRVELRNCKHCGTEFVSVRDGYCSNACKSAYRRAMGYDNITLVCPICGETYETNKYKLAETCSRSCANRLRCRRKHGQG